MNVRRTSSRLALLIVLLVVHDLDLDFRFRKGGRRPNICKTSGKRL